MDIVNVISKRVATRHIVSEPLDREHLRPLIQAAHLAPSSYNHQPWKFWVIAGREHIQYFGQNVAAPGNAWTAECGAIVVVCAVKHQVEGQPENERTMYFDAGLAAQNLMLAAASLNMASCPMGGWDEDALRKWLEMDDKYVPMCCIALGIPKDFDEFTKPARDARERKPLADVAKYF